MIFYGKYLSFITNFEDTMIICGCKTAVVFMVSPLIYDYVGVKARVYMEDGVINPMLLGLCRSKAKPCLKKEKIVGGAKFTPS